MKLSAETWDKTCQCLLDIFHSTLPQALLTWAPPGHTSGSDPSSPRNRSTQGQVLDNSNFTPQQKHQQYLQQQHLDVDQQQLLYSQQHQNQQQSPQQLQFTQHQYPDGDMAHPPPVSPISVSNRNLKNICVTGMSVTSQYNYITS